MYSVEKRLPITDITAFEEATSVFKKFKLMDRAEKSGSGLLERRVREFVLEPFKSISSMRNDQEKVLEPSLNSTDSTTEFLHTNIQLNSTSSLDEIKNSETDSRPNKRRRLSSTDSYPWFWLNLKSKVP